MPGEDIAIQADAADGTTSLDRIIKTEEENAVKRAVQAGAANSRLFTARGKLRKYLDAAETGETGTKVSGKKGGGEVEKKRELYIL